MQFTLNSHLNISFYAWSEGCLTFHHATSPAGSYLSIRSENSRRRCSRSRRDSKRSSAISKNAVSSSCPLCSSSKACEDTVSMATAEGDGLSFVWETARLLMPLPYCDIWVCLSAWWFGCVCVCVRHACACVNGCHNTLDNLITRFTCRTLDDLWCFWKDFSETWWIKLRFIIKAHVIYFHISPQACVDRNWGPLVTKSNSLDMISVMEKLAVQDLLHNNIKY